MLPFADFLSMKAATFAYVYCQLAEDADAAFRLGFSSFASFQLPPSMIA